MSDPLPDWQQLVAAPALAAVLDHPDLRLVDARFAAAALADPQAAQLPLRLSELDGGVDVVSLTESTYPRGHDPRRDRRETR